MAATCRAGMNPPLAVTAKRSSMRVIASCAPSDKASIGGCLIFGGRENQRAQDRYFVCRLRAGRGQRIGRQPADIAIGCKLPPAPAFAGCLVNSDAFALEGFGIERRFVRRFAAQGRLRVDHLAFHAVDETRRRDAAFERFRRQIGPRRCQSWIVFWIERRHGINRNALSAAHRAPAPPGIRRLPGAPAWPTASRHKCRNARRLWLWRQSA